MKGHDALLAILQKVKPSGKSDPEGGYMDEAPESGEDVAEGSSADDYAKEIADILKVSTEDRGHFVEALKCLIEALHEEE